MHISEENASFLQDYSKFHAVVCFESLAMGFFFACLMMSAMRSSESALIASCDMLRPSAQRLVNKSGLITLY